MSDKPKRPLSAYMIWLNSAREQIKAEFPGIKVTEIAKKGGEMWRSMKDKSQWEAKAVKAKAEYTRSMEEFEANGGSTEAPVKKASKRGKKAAPKKPVAKSKKKKDSEEEESEEEESD